jgi:hypothetical protein
MEVSMPKFGSEEDYKRKSAAAGEDFGTLEDEEYVFEITGYDEFAQSPSKYNPEGHPSARLFCKPLAFAQDEQADLVYDDGKPVSPNKYILFWINTNGSLDKPRLGIGPSGPSLGRRLIWAACGMPVKQAFGFEWDELIGKKFIGSTVLDGKYEKIETVRPYRAASKPDRSESRQRRAPAVTAAKEVFGDDIADDEPAF